MHEFLEIPVAASAHAGDIDRMTVLTHWLMAILFIGWGAFFIYTLVRFRQGANPKANYDGVKSHMASYIEWAVAGIELVLIVAFAIPAWAARVDAFPAESEVDRRSRRGRAVRVERALPRRRRPVRPHRHQAGVGGQPARPRSFRSGGEGRLQLDQPAGAAGQQAGRSSTCRARTSFTASASSRCA